MLSQLHKYESSWAQLQYDTVTFLSTELCMVDRPTSTIVTITDGAPPSPVEGDVSVMTYFSKYHGHRVLQALDHPLLLPPSTF